MDVANDYYRATALTVKQLAVGAEGSLYAAGNDGVIAGRTNAVPEPGSLTMLAAAVLVGFSRGGEGAGNVVTHSSKAILLAVAPRVLVYGGAALAIAPYLVSTSAALVFRGATIQDGHNQSEPADADWPHLRGPHYNAHSDETGLADCWPPEGPPVLWTREIGRGYSGVIAVGGQVYTQTQTLTEQLVLALDAETGQTLWKHGYGWPYDAGGTYPGPRATPTWSNGRIYFAGPDGLVRCLDAADGRLLWSVNVNQKFGGRGTDFGYSCSPLVEDGKVILPVGGPSAAVVALDAGDGSTVWASGDAPASYCPAIPITFRGRRQVVAFLQNDLMGFDLASGRLLWQQSYSHRYDEHAAFPLYDEPHLRTMQPFRGGSHLYTLEAARDSGCELQLVRHDERMSNDVASSVLVDGYVYGFDLRDIQSNGHRPSHGEFRCMDFKTGEILWSSDRIGQATIVVADGKLILLNDRGEVLLVRADPQAYRELGRAQVFSGEICWTAPCLHRGRLYVRSPTRLACLDLGKPGLSTRRAKAATAIPSARAGLELAHGSGAGTPPGTSKPPRAGHVVLVLPGRDGSSRDDGSGVSGGRPAPAPSLGPDGFRGRVLDGASLVRRHRDACWQPFFQRVRLHLAGVAVRCAADRPDGCAVVKRTRPQQDRRMGRCVCRSAADSRLPCLLRRNAAAELARGLVLLARTAAILAVGPARGTADGVRRELNGWHRVGTGCLLDLLLDIGRAGRLAGRLTPRSRSFPGQIRACGDVFPW